MRSVFGHAIRIDKKPEERLTPYGEHPKCFNCKDNGTVYLSEGKWLCLRCVESERKIRGIK